MATWRMSNVISLCVESGRVTSNFSWACQSLKERISLSPILSPFHFYFPLTSLALPCIPQMSFDGCQAVGLWQAYSQQYPAMQKTENELWKFVSCGLSAAAVPGQPHIVSAAPVLPQIHKAHCLFIKYPHIACSYRIRSVSKLSFSFLLICRK